MKSRITVKQLGTALKNDEYYNGDALFPFPVNEIQRIMKEVMQSLKDDDQGQKSFTEWYHNLPDSNPDAIAFAAILCTDSNCHDGLFLNMARTPCVKKK